MELVDFLRARLDEDEAVARDATGGPWRIDDESYATSIYGADRTDVVAGGRWGGEASVFDSTADAVHIARHDPARVLREIDAKRRITGAHKADLKGHCRACAHWSSDWVDGHKVDRLSYEGVRAPCLTLRLLALPYSDRPGYREEWRP